MKFLNVLTRNEMKNVKGGGPNCISCAVGGFDDPTELYTFDFPFSGENPGDVCARMLPGWGPSDLQANWGICIEVY